ncbi:hypothetical protein RAJCM14343_3178 [Rhodococcus aetherivorans]|uniref:Uncharacterized protein n=1 Tax=Rhodococcus aetherivorans TaxID=191292 RepID=A0ABQ0YN83_9NOCA|nr:hypothetical protein RAJCM14343_3178 [Rhodococcus aetherivorans]CCW13842.1 hypothetical protein EBESD8_44050 [Rhodococcus aetherivorans]
MAVFTSGTEPCSGSRHPTATFPGDPPDTAHSAAPREPRRASRPRACRPATTASSERMWARTRTGPAPVPGTGP